MSGVRLIPWDPATKTKRVYPWGDDKPDERKCNHQMKVGKTTPIGSYPDGASPYGCHDMAGNVLEWTSTEYNDEAKSVRGGCFFVEADFLRAASRIRVQPGSRGSNLGFRCVRE